MKNSKFLMPALLAVTLVGGTAIATDAISAPYDGHGHRGGYGAGPDGGYMGGGHGCPGMGGEGYGRGYHMGTGDGYHMGRVYDSLTPEKRVQYEAIVKEGRSKIEPLRDALYVKHQEMRALQNSANPDVNAVSKAATEIATLRAKMRAEHENLVQKMEKDLGIKDFYRIGDNGPRGEREGKNPKK